MDKEDFAEVALLMSIASQHPNFPKQQHIFSTVMTRLNEIEAELEEEAIRAKEEAVEEAAKAKLIANRKADEDRYDGRPLPTPTRQPMRPTYQPEGK